MKYLCADHMVISPTDINAHDEPAIDRASKNSNDVNFCLSVHVNGALYFTQRRIANLQGLFIKGVRKKNSRFTYTSVTSLLKNSYVTNSFAL